MGDRGLAGLLDYIRRRVTPDAGLAPDGELLRRYVETKDEPAFELLVRRHGPMVFAVAQRVLRDAHGAEDVFQATFLALARQARSLRRKDVIAGWLYRVALRIAVKARRKTALDLLPKPMQSGPAERAEQTELRAIMAEEIDRLPGQFRTAVILCYLSGHSAEEAARRIGCPRGTILSRLAAARKRLHGQLTRRGIVVPAGSLTAMLAAESAPALTPTLIALAVRAAGPVGALTPNVIHLAQGVLHAMMWTKIKLTAIAVLAVGFIGLGARGYVIATAAAEPQIEKIDPVREPQDNERAKNEDRLHRFLHDASKQRIEYRLQTLDLDDQVEGLKLRIEPLLRRIEMLETQRMDTSLELAESKVIGSKEEKIKMLQARLELQDVGINIVREELTKLRGQMHALRRKQIVLEEEQKLHEKMAAIQIERLERGLK